MSSSTMSGILDQDPRSVPARTLASLREWRRRETVRPPPEKARSASVEVAAKGSQYEHSIHMRAELDDVPGMLRKSRAMEASATISGSLE